MAMQCCSDAECLADADQQVVALPHAHMNTAAAVMQISLTWYMLLVAADGDPAWSKLTDGVKAGEMPFELAHGTGPWQYFKEKPEREHIFSQAMVSSMSQWTCALLLQESTGMTCLTGYSSARCMLILKLLTLATTLRLELVPYRLRKIS